MVDKEVLGRRVRNRVIEYLEVVASPAEQRRYQAAVPLVHVPNELFNRWEDWVPVPPDQAPEHFPLGVYSPGEVAAVASFHATWDSVAARTPDPAPPLPELQQMPVWAEMVAAARKALEEFNIRGKLPE